MRTDPRWVFAWDIGKLQHKSKLHSLAKVVLNRIIRARRLWCSFWFTKLSSIANPGLSWGGRNTCLRGCRVSVTGGGTLIIGESTALQRNCDLVVRSGELLIGRHVHVGTGVVIAVQDRVEIGDETLIGEYVSIRDQDHAYSTIGLTRERGFETAPILIGANVWIGAKVTITKGVSIGDNAVIGANSVVTRDVPANSVVAGVPADIIKMIKSDR